MNIPAKVYYDKISGFIYFITSEMSGNVIPMSDEQLFKLHGAALENVDTSNISSIELEFGYDFTKPIKRIDPNTGNMEKYNSEMIPYVRSHNNTPYPMELSKEEVVEMYNNEYLEVSLPVMLTLTGIEFKWVLLKDIQIKEHFLSLPSSTFTNNPYLNDYEDDKTSLGKDIIKNGMFWPFFVSSPSSSEGNQQPIVAEGGHRLVSLRLLQFMGEIPDDFRVLCIYAMNSTFNYKNNPKNSIRLDSERYLSIPKDAHFGDVKDKSQIESMIESSKSITERNRYAVTELFYTHQECMVGAQSYPHYIRNLLYDNIDIKPSKIVNDQEEFKLWIKRHQPELYNKYAANNFETLYDYPGRSDK